MRERRSQDERQREIVEAALHIISQRGITALTVASLAKEIGLTGGALYRHFSSTSAILEAVAATIVERLDATLPDAEIDPLEWLERFVESRSRAVSGRLMRIILSEQVTKAMPPQATRLIQGAVKSTFAAIERALAAGQRQGVIRDDVEPADLVPIVVGTVQLLALAHAGEPMRRVVHPSRVVSTLRALLAAPAPARRS